MTASCPCVRVRVINYHLFLATGDLFDFDIEVKPILEVLVGKNMEQSLLEVMEEEELAHLRAQQRAFEELRNAELVEQQRLEEQVNLSNISFVFMFGEVHIDSELFYV